MSGRLRLTHGTLGLLLMVAALVGSWGSARAENTLEKLLMPGPVVEGHAKIENDCQACHTPFSKDTQDTLCLDCHKPIKADVTSKQGFHGRSPLLKGLACNFCHDDHKGRAADIIQFNTAAFDHLATDFPLSGPHLNVPCADCHVKDKPWAEAKATCFDCHEKQQPHKGNLGKACEDCHKVTSWRDTKPFDHAKTKFDLRGKHKDVTCAACHLGEVYKDMATSCNDCHAIQDVHRKRFGTECKDCHTEQDWTKDTKFDHATKTRFPLKGAHADAKCQSCHGKELLIQISRVCFDCHAKQDVHKAQLGAQCGDCHTDVSWSDNVSFDHGLTKFPLNGLHVVVACESCHATPAYKDAKLACVDCHAKDDVHKGRLTTQCASCHTANGWNRVSFDHGKQTKFPLTGKHAKAGCYDCHTQKNVADASISTTCYSCHAKQDVHRGAFGKDCQRCHDTNTFKTAIIRR